MTAPLPQTTPAPRSLAVSSIAVLGMAGGIVGTLAALAALLLRPSAQAAVALIGAPFALAAARGLWRRREWARQSTVVVMALSIGYLLLLLAVPSILDRQAGVTVHLGRIVIGQLVFYGILDVLIMAKLLTKRVREEFDAAD